MQQNRPPIVVILGHVDHGKTSLLDFLRKSNVAAHESGGITQHIKSFIHKFEIRNSTSGYSYSEICFIDTPGHAAFSAMRERGSQLADLAILVVAGNDGVMPQTKQSIQFITQAKLPFIVAINKSDLPTFDPDRVKTQLTESGIVVEDYGGNIPSVSISAKTGAGIPDLLEVISLMSQLNPPLADPDADLSAVVLESRLDPQKGPLAVAIVKSGTLKTGQNLFQGTEIGKVKALINSDAKNISIALPSTPVEILGLKIVPVVGSLISSRIIDSVPVSEPKPPIVASQASADFKLILKSDVAGSLEAILNSLPPTVSILASGTGEVTDSDIDLAKTSGATVIAFNTKISPKVAKLAEIEKVPLKSFKIIYELLEFVTKLLTPTTVEEVTGQATVLAEFKMNGDRIAGCRCLEGLINKGDQIKIMRADQLVGLTRVKNLQSGKASVDKIKSGAEFGVVFSPYIDFKLQDSIIAFTTHATVWYY